MVNNNDLINLVNNKKPVELVQELKDYEIKKSPLSPAARDKVISRIGSNFLSKNEGYGPCSSSLCGCSCPSYSCNCYKDIARNKRTGSSFTVHGKLRKEFDPEDWDEAMMKAVGAKNFGASGQLSASAFGYKDSQGELKVLSGTAGGEVSRGGIKGKLSADLYNIKTDGFQGRVGVAADTGFSVENGLEVKAVGFGFSVGKQTGISTPIGEIKFDTEDCVIQ